MTSLTVPDLDDELVARLMLIAKARRVSIETLAAEIIRDAVPDLHRSSIRMLAESIAAMTPKGVTQTDSTILIREDRDR